ncbi:MAG: queuosine precursor transporter [Pseudomonadales bacterium]|nr:queuosine precursor transporter [Pseudomonadales bacterium]
MADQASESAFPKHEKLFLLLAGVFICAMTMLNILGITRFIEIGPMALAVGVLPYPITFLCTDLICELYGKQRANFVVTIGLVLNGFILSFLWLGQIIPAVPPESMPPWQLIHLAEPVALPNGEQYDASVELFDLIYACTSGAVFASMLAYIFAQYCDVRLFHFFKKLTNGKHLWLRNNGSTLISQAVDSFVVIMVTFGAVFFQGDMAMAQLLTLMASNYLFKMTVAIVDTLPFYYLVNKLKPIAAAV